MDPVCHTGLQLVWGALGERVDGGTLVGGGFGIEFGDVETGELAEEELEVYSTVERTLSFEMRDEFGKERVRTAGGQTTPFGMLFEQFLEAFMDLVGIRGGIPVYCAFTYRASC